MTIIEGILKRVDTVCQKHQNTTEDAKCIQKFTNMTSKAQKAYEEDTHAHEETYQTYENISDTQKTYKCY